MLLQNRWHFQMLLRLKQRCLQNSCCPNWKLHLQFPKMTVPVPSTSDRRCGMPEVLGTYDLHLLSVLSCWSPLDAGVVWVCTGMGHWVWGFTPCCYLRGDSNWPPVDHDILYATGFCPLQMAGGCIFDCNFCLCSTCKMELVWKAVIKWQKTIPWQVESAV